MQGEFAALRSEIRRLDQRTDGLDNRVEPGERLSTIERRLPTIEARR